MVARKPRKETGSPVPSVPDVSADASENASAGTQFYLDESSGTPVITETETEYPVIAWEYIPCGNDKPTPFAAIKDINPLTSAMRFAEAVRVDPVTRHAQAGRDGKAQRYLIKRSPKPVIVWAGTIEITRKYRAYDITSERTLIKTDSSRIVTVRVTNAHGIVTTSEIPLQHLRATGDRAQWVDDLDLHESMQTNMLKAILITMTSSREDNSIAVHSQGPFYLSDDTIAFAAKSGAFDESGKARNDVIVDISSTVIAALRYYDVTPAENIARDQAIAGIGLLRLALTESPDYPEIPAAHAGQIYTSPLSTINHALWSGILLSGVTGSGKTRYAARWDAIQSSKTWKRLDDIKPTFSFGDTTGTVNGQQYRSVNYGGYAITTDDVIKNNDTDFRIREQTDKVSNLTRSFETGGGARAKPNHKLNKVADSDPPALASSIRITSEKPLTGDSLQNRLVMLPHLTQKWSYGGYFSREISEELSTPESMHLAHLAWSAYVRHLITRHGSADTHLENARRITETWGLGDMRQAGRYAVLIAGHTMFGEFTATYDIDYSGDIKRVIAALRKCAERQAGNSTPLAVRFVEALRLEIVRGHLSYPGPPVLDPDGVQSATSSTPGIVIPGVPGDDGITEDKRDLGGFSYDELGLVVNGATVKLAMVSQKPLGYLVPPRSDKGGHLGDSLTRGWVIAHKREQFTALCEQLTRASRDHGSNFNPKDVIESLRSTGKGDNGRLYVDICTDKEGSETKRKQDRYIYIDAVFALKDSESENDS